MKTAHLHTLFVVLGIIVALLLILTIVSFACLKPTQLVAAVSCERQSNKLHIKLRSPTSLRFLISYDYKFEGDTIYLTVRDTAFPGVFLFSFGSMNVSIPVEKDTLYTVILTDGTQETVLCESV